MRSLMSHVIEDIQSNLPTNIRKMRMEAGLTQAQLAKKIPKATQATISNWENTVSPTPISLVQYLFVCMACNVSVDNPISKLIDIEVKGRD